MIGASLATVSAENIPPNLDCDQITTAMKGTVYGTASYMRMLDQYNRLCIDIKAGCPSNANLDIQAKSCTTAGMYFYYYLDPSTCRQVRCSATVPTSSSSTAGNFSSSSEPANGPGPNGDALTNAAVACKNKYEKYEYYTGDNGCRQLRCIPNVASQASCPNPTALLQKAQSCKDQSKDYESYTEGVCKMIRCLDETIGSSSSCADDTKINADAVNCSKLGLHSGITSDSRGCRKVTCLEGYSSATSSCPSDADLDKGIQVCKNSGLLSTTMPDEHGCRQVICNPTGSDSSDMTNTSSSASSISAVASSSSAADCSTLRAEMVWMLNNKQIDSSAYANDKAAFTVSCATKGEPPAAGFEDQVLTTSDLSTMQSPFPDTDTSTLDGKSALELYRRGVIGGFPDGTFKGDQPVNRAEAAKFLLLACAKNTDAPFSGTLRDVLDGQWYTPFVEAAAKQGIIAGYPDGSFKPGNTVIRAEFLKMLTKACGLQQSLPYSYKDVSSTDWFAIFAGVAQKYSLFPNATTLLQPSNVMSRNDVAVAIYQYLSKR